jgi:SnoaL-like domain
LSIDLPEPIADYFGADRVNGDAIAHCFTSNAVVKDEDHTYNGIEAIRKWNTKASAKYRYTAVPLASEKQGGTTVVTSRLTGSFPGSPVTLRYLFRLERGKISFLEIVP